MRELVDATIGVIAIVFVVFLFVAGPITLLVVGFLLPFLLPVVLVLLIAGGFLAALVNTVRHWFGRS
jgi:hypothetical protein